MGKSSAGGAASSLQTLKAKGGSRRIGLTLNAQRRYLLSSLEKVAKTNEDRREVILYVGVSTHSQKEDLKSVVKWTKKR